MMYLINTIMVFLGVFAVVILYRRIRRMAEDARRRILLVNLILLFLFWALFKLELQIVAVLMVLINIGYIGLAAKEEEAKFNLLEDQLVNALIIISGGLKAGRSLEQGFELVSRSMPDPISTEFREVLQEVELGVPFEDAMKNLMDRVRSRDYKLFVTATLFQRETGGNLIALYDQIISAVSERRKVAGRLESIVLQQKYSAYVLMFLPVALFLILNYMNPGHTDILFNDPVGKLCFYSAIFLQILGVVIMRAILSRQPV